ncbi:MAG TPA: CARDB domain-containing protein [Pyrinomonadaceae bacterium]|nr:CARDB domain-containing protein [Pyrinomonadaceae bacterium]
MTDLVANTMTASPVNPVAGERVRIEVPVTNRSDNPTGNVEILFFAGTGQAGSATLNVGPRQTVVAYFDWSAGPDGVQQLTAVVDPDHRFVEENFDDNVAAMDVVVSAPTSKATDFSVSNLELIKQNERSLLRATVTNHGKVSESIPIIFRADDRVIAARYVTALPAGEKTVIEVEYSDVNLPGRIEVEVNPRFRSFAKRATTLTETLAPSVDLRVEAVQAAQFEAAHGKQVTLSFRIRNAGAKPVSKSFRTSIFPGTVTSGTLHTDFITTSSLAPGETIYVSRTLNSPSGDFDIRIEVDVDNVAADDNRANNVVNSHFKNPVRDIDRWVSIGPRRINNNIGAVGVLARIAVDPHAPATIYVSAPGSGVWKTINGGANWQPITDALPTLVVAALALDPSNPATVYVATNDFGVFASKDGGGTWKALDPPTFRPSLAVNEVLLVDPSNPNRLLLTSMTGVYVRNESALIDKWKLVLPGSATDLIADPSRPGTFFATLSGPDIGIYRSLDSGQNWSKLGGCPGSALPSIEGVAKNRITLGLSGSTLYAAFKTGKVKYEVFRTRAGISCSFGGQQESQWERRFSITDPDPDHDPNPVAVLFNRLNVDPVDPKFVYISGIDFQVSTNGGTSFNIISGQQPHVDHHDFAVDPNDPRIIYVVTDGGIFRSSNRGNEDTWQFIGDGIFNVQFYDSALAATDQTMVIGGTQDNGTLAYSGSTAWDHIRGGDGGTVAIDPTNSEIKYSMNQGQESMGKHIGRSKPLCISCGDLTLLARCFNLAFQVHPVTPATLLAPCHSLWQATSPVCARCSNTDEDDAGAPQAWQEILPKDSVRGGVVRTAIDPTLNLYYAGTTGGDIWAGPGGTDWRLLFKVAGEISDIEIDPDDPATVYISTSKRIFRLRRSTTLPTKLTITAPDISLNLPSALSVKTLAVDRMNPFTIYAGTNKGVYRGRSFDGGASWSWSAYLNGLPLADVRDLEIHPVSGVMLAATFGRSAYKVNTGPPLGSLLSVTGKVTFLRVNDVGTGIGSPTDFLDAEAIVQLDSQPGRSFGFTLRNGVDLADHGAMLDLLRSAFGQDRTVRLEFIRTGLKNGRIIRVEKIN